MKDVGKISTNLYHTLRKSFDKYKDELWQAQKEIIKKKLKQ